MREIKFRAWYLENLYNTFLKNGFKKKRMVYFDLDTYDQSMTSEECYESIMQFTGLKDKNGKEIYEGDIVKFWQIHPTRGVETAILKIEWDNDYSKFWATDGHKFEDVKGTEVIGNIYENKELLEV